MTEPAPLGAWAGHAASSPTAVLENCHQGGRGVLTLIQVDVVLPLLLVACAVVPGALQDVSPVPDVMADGHLLESTVRVPDGPPRLPDLGGWGRKGGRVARPAQDRHDSRNPIPKTAARVPPMHTLTPPGAERISEVS